MVLPYKTVTKRPEETARLGQELADWIKIRSRGDQAKIVCLYGQLGSGKTTFCQGFAKGLGIGGRLLSPTFIIVRRYELPNNQNFLYHIDLYRVNGKDLSNLGLEEIFADSSALVLVEWAEKLGALMQKRRIDVHFSAEDDGHAITLKEFQ